MVTAAFTRLSYLIRLVETSDAPGVYALERACFPDPYPSVLLYDLIKSQGTRFFVAVDSGAIIGYAVASLKGIDGHVISLGVDPRRRRRGVGTDLMSAVEMKLVQDGAERICFEVRKGNAGAILFYERRGYRAVAETRHYYYDGEDALVFERSVESSADPDYMEEPDQTNWRVQSQRASRRGCQDVQ